MNSKSSKNAALWFLVKLMGLYTLWNWLFPVGQFNNLLTAQLGQAGVWGLRLFGLEASLKTEPEPVMLFVGKQPLLIVGDPCNGIEFFGLFACFVLAFPAQFRHKLWFLPVGILSIHLLNVLRVIALSLNYYFFRTSFDFNHKYTFVVIVYGVMLGMWMKWAKTFSAIAPSRLNASHA